MASGTSTGRWARCSFPFVVAQTSFAFGFVGIGITGLAAGLLALAGPATTRRRLEQVSV